MMYDKQKMSWMVGVSAVALALAGWMLPRRRKTPLQKAMLWSRKPMNWMKAMSGPMSQMVMKSGMRMIKGR